MNSEPVEAFARTVDTVVPVAVEGGRTRWLAGGRPEPDTELVRAPVTPIDFRPEEMTVTVGAGVTVATLHETTAAARQRTALPERRGSTVGGAIAVGESSVDRLGRGHVREAVLALEYVSAEGRVVHAGGPTVKNVSGFDLCRLMVGSLGTLGLIARATLRTIPIDDREIWFAADDVDPRAVLATCGRAHSILWDGSCTWVHLCGMAAEIDAEAERLATIGSFAEADAPTLPPHRHSMRPEDLRRPPEGAFVAEIGVGIVHRDVAPEPVEIDHTVSRLNERIKAQFDPTGRLNPGRSVLEVRR